MKKQKYTFIDLFAGCGGLSEGFLQTGRFVGLAHVEWEKPMVSVLRNRLVEKWNHSIEDAKKRVVMFDIQKTDELLNGNWSDESIKRFGAENNQTVKDSGLDGIIEGKKVDFIIGGPPCQAYSIHGRATDKDSMQDDYRNYLFDSFCKVVNHYKPDVFVFENVAGLLSAKPGGIPVRQRIYEAFTKIGYTIRQPENMQTALLDVVDFGVPQHRPRVIILGVKNGTNTDLNILYDAISKEKSENQTTVRDAIGYLPPLYPLEKPIKVGRKTMSHSLCDDNNITFHECRNHSERDMHIFKDWISGDMNHISHKDMVNYYYEMTGHRTLFQKYKNLEWDKPSHTIVAHLSKDGYMFIHPDIKQLRSITIREAANLMTFPMDFHFSSSTPYNYRMIGNAVPVQFAKALATALYKVTDNKK